MNGHNPTGLTYFADIIGYGRNGDPILSSPEGYKARIYMNKPHPPRTDIGEKHMVEITNIAERQDGRVRNILGFARFVK